MQYDAVILDLDGVVYIGSDAVPFAIDSLNSLAFRGVTLTAATNNANRPAAVVAAHLHQLGLRIDATHVMTSAQAAGRYLANQLPAASPVLAIGGEGVAESLHAAGLVALRASEDLAASSAAADAAMAVLIGYGPRVAWFDLAAAHWAIMRGKPWVATNTDPTVPLPFGNAPGNGAMVELLERSTGSTPTVIGKPKPSLFEELARALGTRRVLVIGDRLDTDIDGAIAAGMDSVLVCTGVHGPADLAARPATRWPTYVAQDLRSLLFEPTPLSQHELESARSTSLAGAVVAALRGNAQIGTWRTEAPSPLFELRGMPTNRPPSVIE